MKHHCLLWIFSLLLLPVTKGLAADVFDLNKVVQNVGVSAGASCEQSTKASTIRRPLDPTKLWENAGFKNVHVESWPDIDKGEPKKFTHQMGISAVLFRNSDWTKTEIKQRLRRVAEILSQCGIKISYVELIESDLPEDWKNIDSSKMQEIARKTPVARRPIFYYIAQSGESASGALSWPASVSFDAKLTDTVWVSDDLTIDEGRLYELSFSAETHELGHVLANTGQHDYSQKQNYLANSTGLLNDTIKPDQCKVMRKSTHVEPL